MDDETHRTEGGRSLGGAGTPAAEGVLEADVGAGDEAGRGSREQEVSDADRKTKGSDRPPAGKAGVHGKFEVEVVKLPSGTRSFARRFKTEAEAVDFYDRTVRAHRQKANRERRGYVVAVYETKTERSAEVGREINSTMVQPVR